MNEITSALEGIGYAPLPDEELVVVQFVGGKPVNYLAPSWPQLTLDTDTYAATGRFHAGTIAPKVGRSAENVASIISLPFDFDATSHTSMSQQYIRFDAGDDELDAIIDDMLAVAKDVFSDLGLPLHRIDRTGYGLAVHVYLKEDEQHLVDDARDIHKRLVDRINERAGYPFADTAVSDAGPRIMRLPGCLNTKGRVRRESETIHFDASERFSLAHLDHVAGEPLPRRTTHRVTSSGATLGDDAVQTIVDAVRPSWSEGNRHALALAVAGMMAGNRVSQDEAGRVMLRVAEASGDREISDRLRAVETTYQRAQSGLATAGFSRLGTLLPASALDVVDRTLKAFKDANEPEIVITALVSDDDETDRAAAQRIRVEPLPTEALIGPTGRYVRLMQPTTEAPIQFHAASFLTWLGALVGRRAFVYQGHAIYPNLYTLLLGDTGFSRKDTAINRALGLIDYAPDIDARQKLPFHVLSDISSGEGLISALVDHNEQLLVMKELTSVMSKAERRGSETMIDVLINAYDAPATLENKSKNNPQVATRPTLSILSASQPGRVARKFTFEIITSGFVNRFLVVPGRGSDEDLDMPPPPDAEIAASLVADVFDTLGHALGDEPTQFAVHPECAVYWRKYYQKVKRSSGTEEGEFRSRFTNHALKLALLYAVSDPDLPGCIRLEHLTAGVAFAEWSWQNTQQYMNDWGVSPESQCENAIRTRVRANPGKTKTEIRRWTSSRNWNAITWNRVFKALQDAGEIVVTADNHVFPVGATIINLNDRKEAS